MPLTPLRPGDPAQVGPHRLLGRLGQGGMGTVYLGLTPSDRAVAVKVLRDGPPDLECRRRFRSELQALQRVRDPHLVEVLDADPDAATPWLVTRFVPGRRLDELVAETGPLPAAELVPVALGVARALAALHAGGVIHRDLTPGNVLLVDGRPHVIDLGLALLAELPAVTRTGLVVGTAGYLAPEQVTGVGSGPAADVHAWGATLALAGTGRPPYGTGRPDAVLYRVVHGTPDLAGLPADLLPLVAAALAKEPADRPAVSDLVGALEELAGRAGPIDGHPEVAVPGARALVGVTSGPHSAAEWGEDAAGTTVLGADATTVLGADATTVLGRDAGPAVGTAPEAGRPPAASPGGPPAPDVAATLASTGTSAFPLPGPPAALPPPVSPETAALRTAVLPAPEQRRSLPEGAEPWRPAPLPPADPPSAWHGARPAPVQPTQPTQPDARRPGHLQRAVVAVPAVLLCAAGALLAPVMAAVAAVVLLVVLQTGARAVAHRRALVDRRGPRRRDPVVGALGLPWRLLGAVVDLLLGVPLLVVGAGLPAYAVQQSVGGTVGTAYALAAATVLGTALTLSREPYRAAREALGRIAAAAGPTPGRALVVGGLLLGAALVAVAAGVDNPRWWPLDAVDVQCVPWVTCG